MNSAIVYLSLRRRKAAGVGAETTPTFLLAYQIVIFDVHGLRLFQSTYRQMFQFVFNVSRDDAIEPALTIGVLANHVHV